MDRQSYYRNNDYNGNSNQNAGYYQPRYTPRSKSIAQIFRFKKIYVAGFPPRTSIRELEILFSAYGTVVNANFPSESTGFAFIEFSDAISAQKAVRNAHGCPFKGSFLKVNWAKSRVFSDQMSKISQFGQTVNNPLNYNQTPQEYSSFQRKSKFPPKKRFFNRNPDELYRTDDYQKKER